MKKLSVAFLSAFALAACDGPVEPIVTKLEPQPHEVLITKYRVAMGANVFATTYAPGEPGTLIARTPVGSEIIEDQYPCDPLVVPYLEQKLAERNEFDPANLAELKNLRAIGGISTYGFSDVDGAFDHDEGLDRASKVVSVRITLSMEKALAAHKNFCPKP